MTSPTEGKRPTAAQLYDLSNRVAVITGGGTGIGAATALTFALHGADVVLAGRTLADLERSAAAVRETGRRCLIVQSDVRDEQQVVQLIKRTVEELGRIDIVVNGAGGSDMQPFAGLSTADWDQDYNLNVRSAYFTTREAGRYFREQRSGAVINISSVAGVYGVKGGVHYSSAKAALVMFTKVAAAEWAPHGIRINCVAPGLIESERPVAAMLSTGVDPSVVSQYTPLRRNGQPQDIANAIHFLVSDASSYITGHTLVVDGGPSIGGIPNT